MLNKNVLMLSQSSELLTIWKSYQHSMQKLLTLHQHYEHSLTQKTRLCPCKGFKIGFYILRRFRVSRKRAFREKRLASQQVQKGEASEKYRPKSAFRKKNFKERNSEKRIRERDFRENLCSKPAPQATSYNILTGNAPPAPVFNHLADISLRRLAPHHDPSYNFFSKCW